MLHADRCDSQVPDVTVSVRVVQRLIDAVEQAGVPRDELMRVLGSAALPLHDPDARISGREVDRMCELAVDLTGDPALALHWAVGLTERTFAPVSQVLGYAGSLRKSFALLSEYDRLFCDRAFFALSESEQLATLRLFPGWTFSSTRMVRFAAEMAVGGFLVVIRLFSQRAGITRVCFDYPAPSYRDEYTRALGDVPVHFDQSFTGVVFDREVLDLASPHSDADIHHAMQSVAERRLLRVAKNAPYALRVRDVLKQRAPERANMASVARTLGLSVRTLRRQLSAEATSYREIEYAVLAAMARHLLCDKQLSIQETAYAMGFSDAATFHRALKQWTGMTPTELRASVGAT
jgi:AraC-like DNA-binding protein